ncbi:hypothetical protein [Streptomyces platensis]|uniref:hypothetical protein n=1 Tax=Streptomyces platensis TaxID=58346 RepID=UPI001F26B4B2|nr:hypothetical protein [Streptomyces platensis]MCF3142586.1 hypothetical protein [Streptomyces platensis]
MTGNEDRDTRAERLRAGFQQQGVPGLAEDEVRKDRQRRLVHTVVAAVLTLGGLALLVVRLLRGDQLGTWTACYAAGTVLTAVGGVLARRISTRLAFAVVLLGVVAMSIGDAVTR